MWRYPDGTFKTNPPATVVLDGAWRKFTGLTREQWDGLGYNEAVPVVREPYTTYETAWAKGEDLIYRETVTSTTVDDGSKFAAEKTSKQAEIVDGAETYLCSLCCEYGDMEKATWDQQYDEAMAYTADSGADVPLLSAIASSRGMTLATLAERVIANRASWVVVAGDILGQRLAYQDLLDAAVVLAETDVASALEALEAIDVEYSATVEESDDIVVD